MLSPVFGEVDVFVVSVSFVSGVDVVSGVSGVYPYIPHMSFFDRTSHTDM